MPHMPQHGVSDVPIPDKQRLVSQGRASPRRDYPPGSKLKGSATGTPPLSTYMYIPLFTVSARCCQGSAWAQYWLRTTAKIRLYYPQRFRPDKLFSVIDKPQIIDFRGVCKRYSFYQRLSEGERFSQSEAAYTPADRSDSSARLID